jgi:hypothetical protein
VRCEHAKRKAPGYFSASAGSSQKCVTLPALAPSARSAQCVPSSNTRLLSGHPGAVRTRPIEAIGRGLDGRARL